MTVPTDIQKLAIPLIMEGKNVCGNARTGSGKTAAFALPIIQHLSKDPYGIFALVITPTRELALQVCPQSPPSVRVHVPADMHVCGCACGHVSVPQICL